jgi:ketosteroid isomerase-like protein
MQTQHNDSIEKDKQTLIAMVKNMTESTTGAQSTKDWADDALWFDIPPFASKGITPAVKMFDTVFKNFKSCKIAILTTEVILSTGIGIVCTVQKVDIVFQNDSSKSLFVRETDCFQKWEGTWELVHQHASVPSGGEWDGKIITA